ncbi:helix-turn-helix domain-containing protein [Paenibacillus radicis (ex Gao et al. 2016)]|uniref:HTH-type transcriptional regulator YtdP n=1 Tax=Paenibacillus radicis (ex Gao et al. 2016) TaxID=1737354 RepID=A0A917HP76_9BACL|nr:helix-turn-helix domain-containing protein [Paenibacillus radicis (ex Gao et al. 2016)]GGG86062.1 putative HTH-type transcriptional regulator YtdP [Paenibacillus radicis (ex Gao et al. 2016)]
MNLTSLWNKRKSIVFTWLISYSAVLIVPIIISLIIYSQSSMALKSEIHRANDSLLKQVRYTIDNQIDLMKRLNMELTWNSKLQSLINSTGKPSEAQFGAYQLVKEFRTYKTSYASIDEFYVAWEQGASILRPGNVRDLPTAFQTIHQTGTMTYEGWLDTIRKSASNRFTLLPRGDAPDTKQSIAYITHLPKDLSGQETGTVVVMADTVRFSAAIENISGFSGGQALVLNADNEVLLSNKPVTEEITRLLQNHLNGISQASASETDGDLELFYMSSAVSDLKYMLVIPSNIYWQKAEYVRKFTYISIVISILGAVVLTWFFMRRNYSPIKQIVQSLMDRSAQEERVEWNELSFIERAITRTRSEKEQIATELKIHQHALRSNMFNRLLKGRVDTLVPYEEAFQSFGIELQSDQFAVILFAVENGESISSELPGLDGGAKMKLLQFIITNVVEELSGQQGHYGYVAEIDDMMACIVNLSEADAGGRKDELQQIASEAQRFLMRFQMDLTVSISGTHTSLPGIAEAYQEAVDAMEYKMVLGKKGIIHYDDIRFDNGEAVQSGYYYPLQVEQQMINFIKAGDFAQASYYMNDIMQRNFAQPIMSLTLAKTLIFNLVGTMAKAINELGDGESSLLGDNPLWMEKILACDTIQEMQTELQQLLGEVCVFAAARNESHMTQERAESLRGLAQDVVRYIEEEYRDPNLNVNMIGERFDLKGSYLSKLFKSQIGEGLLDYIHKFRIEQAKELIRCKQSSISDIAKQVGYNEAATFIRVFKKFEGITPGKYKEMI